MTLRSILLLPLAVGALAGCGLKGPLYLPEEKEQKVSEQSDGEQQRKERTRDAGAQTPAAPTGASTSAASEPPPEN